MATALEVTKYFLSLPEEESGDTISNLKLQKLLYYAQGFHLALFDAPLFGEPVIAWRHGPVVRRVYQEYAGYGSASIPAPDDFDPAILEQDKRDFLDEVYKVYGQYSAWRLRGMTHEEAPWRDTWCNGEGESNEIPHAAMKAYFNTLINEGNET